MAVLDDMMPRRVALVFVGEAVGDESALQGHYYAKPGNLFWDDVFESGLTPIRLTPEQDWRLPGYGMGLTDIVKDLTNSQLKKEAYVSERWQERAAQLAERIQAAGPRVVCFNGLTCGMACARLLPLCPF